MKTVLSKIMKNLSVIFLPFTLMIGSANASVLGFKMNGFYCNLCTGGTVTQIKAVPNVDKVILWVGSGILWVYGNPNISEVKRIINNSSYPLIGAWSCPQPTLKLASCSPK